MKKIIFFLLPIVSCTTFIIFINVFFISNSKLDDFQSNNFSLKFVHFGVCYIDETISLNLKDKLQKDGKLLQQVYTRIDETLYFSYQYVENDNVHWCIATIKDDGSDLSVVSDEIFSPKSLHEFEINLSESYRKRNGYYYKNKIVLTDFSKLLEYDIENKEEFVCEYSNYNHPTESFYCTIDDYKKITIRKNNQTHILTLSDLTKKNNIAKTIFEKYNHKIIDGTKACTYFFDNIQFINGHIYIVCRIHRWDGCAYALVFEYDFQTKDIVYLGGHYTNDLVRHFYLIDDNQGTVL